jgi:hypothetical protein
MLSLLGFASAVVKLEKVMHSFPTRCSCCFPRSLRQQLKAARVAAWNVLLQTELKRDACLRRSSSNTLVAMT